MLKCCINGCNSEKCNGTKNICFFKFPVHDEILLKKWLNQINLPNWKPNEYHHICSLHFKEEDIDSHPNRKEPCLKPTSIPTIFPKPPVETSIVDPKNSLALSMIDQLKSSAKIVNIVSNTKSNASILQTNPTILIPSPYPGHLSAQFPTQIIAQNFNQTTGNTSVQITAEQIKQLALQNMQISFHNTLQYIEQIKTPIVQSNAQISGQYIKQISLQNPLQINTNNGIQVGGQRPKEIIVQTPVQQYPKQVASQNSTDVGKDNPKKVTTSMDPKQDRNEICETDPQLLSTSMPRLRKILPKPQLFNPDTLPTVGMRQNYQSDSALNSIPKPDILIIPKFEKSHAYGSGKVVFTRYPDNKRPILRINIKKEYESKETDCPQDEEERNTNSSTKEITIENSKTNRAVTFKLDPSTGEIVVTTSKLDDTIMDETESKSTRTEQKIDDTHSSAAKLRQLYIQGQQECNALRKRLRILRQRHKQEQDEIYKLQEHLAELADKVQSTCSDESELDTRCTKRKEREKSVQTDEYETLMQEVKKIKQNAQRTRGNLSTITNGQSKGCQTRANCNNGPSRFSKVEFHSPEIVNLSEGEIIGEIDDNCDIVMQSKESFDRYEQRFGK